MRFRWGDCALDREGRSLARGGRPVAVQPLVFDLLVLLLQNRSRVVAEEVLRRELWPGVRVTDASLRRVVKEARRAVGDDGERQDQIETLRGRGLRFAAPVTTEDGWDTSFVGRGDLVEALEQTLEAVLSGIGAVTLLHGPAGIGKTRTLLEFGARAEARGMHVLRGAGRLGAEGDAFHPWLEIGGDFGVEELLRDARGGDDRAVEADSRRFARFREVARVFASHASERPLLIALDDLQFADADSLALLRYLATALRSSRIWLLASFRSGALAGEGRLPELTALGAETSSQVVAMRGLGADELRAVVQNQLRVEVGARTAALLSARTEGNPLFALEVARSAHADEKSLRDDASRQLGAELVTRIEPLLARRTSALRAETKQLLTAAAAIGSEFDPALVQAAEGCSARSLKRALDEATAAALLDPAFGGKRRFAHPLFAEALYAELAARPDDATAQHLRIAESLERLAVPEPFLLARHFLAARPRASAARILPFLRAAAREAMRRVAVADAELWYRRAIELAEQGGAQASELCDLLVALGDVVITGDGLHAARVFYERAIRLAAREGDSLWVARASLAYAHRPFSMEAQAPVLEWLGAAHAAPCEDLSLRALVAARLGAEYAVAGPEHAVRSSAFLAEGLSIARQLGDAFTLGRVLTDQSLVTFSADEPRAWLSLSEEIARRGREGRDLEIEFRGLYGTVMGHMQLGERTAAEEAFSDCQRFALEHASHFTNAITRGMEAMFSLLDGRFAEARAAIDAEEKEARAASSRGLTAVVMGQRFWLSVEEGQPASLVPTLEAIRAQFPRALLLAAVIALGQALDGMIDPARTSLGRVVEGLPSLARDWSRLPTLAVAAEAAFRVRAPEAAGALEHELEPYGPLHALNPNASIYLGSIWHALGWTAAARGARREAIERFERALLAHQTLRSEPWCARTARAIDEVKRTDRPVRLVS
jgi:DNA-binding winged helix-turn-helix (wHTH) protein/tetratricopeptide (TPR) repeat protein